MSKDFHASHVENGFMRDIYRTLEPGLGRCGLKVNRKPGIPAFSARIVTSNRIGGKGGPPVFPAIGKPDAGSLRKHM